MNNTKTPHITKKISLALLCLLLGSYIGSAQAEQRFIAMGTASKEGVYYVVGKEVCALINLERIDHGVRCIAFETGGSVYNLYAIASGNMDVAITRIDLAYDALHGLNNFITLPEGTKLRSIATLYKMPVGVLIHKNSPIKSFADFPGKVINIGNLGSGRRDISDRIFSIMDWNNDTFRQITEYKTSDMETEFCNGSVDILIGAFAIPAAFYDKLTADCDAVFLPFPEDVIKQTIKLDPAFERGVIPGGFYSANPVDVPTIQINTLLVTSADTHANAIQQLMTSLFDNIERFQTSHPALADFTLQNVYQAQNAIPLHQGVIDYLTENGLPVSSAADQQDPTMEPNTL